MSYSIEVQNRLCAWRQAAGAISAALEAGSSANWTDARRTYDTAFEEMFAVPDGVSFDRVELAGVPALVARLSEAPTADRTVLYFHGGGYASGSAEAYRAFAGHLARNLKARIVVPDYRLAPQHPLPAPIEDGFAVYRALLRGSADPSRLAIAGDSAGGAMTLTVLRRLRNADLSLPAAALVFSPWADLSHTGASAIGKAERDPLVRLPFLQALADAYLDGVDPAHPDASPIHADFAGLPPILIQVGEREVMLSDAVRLAERLGEDGVRVTLEAWPEMFHVFQLFTRLLPQADEALRNAGAFLARALEPARSR